MTIANAKRALSTPSATPTMPYTPESIASARERFDNNKRTEARQRLKEDIDRYLRNDTTAFKNARTKTKKSVQWNLLSGQEQEQALEASTLAALQHRKDNGLHVSCYYPVFVDYVPQGKVGHKDEEKHRLMYKQIDLLESQGFRTGRDEESDDDEPNPYLKKEEGEDTPALEGNVRHGTEHASRSIENGPPAERYSSSGKRATKPSLPTPKHRSARFTSTSRPTNYTEPDSSKDEYDSDSEGLTSLASESSDSSDSDSDSGSDSDSISNEPPSTTPHRVRRPLIAVTRRLPLLPDNPNPTPTSTSTNSTELPKHRFSTTKKTFRLKAVLRGQVPKEPDTDAEDVEWVWVENKGLTPRKKRVRGAETVTEIGSECMAEEVEVCGQEYEHEHKKAKVEEAGG